MSDQQCSEAVNDALRLQELFHNKMLEELRSEINKGWDAPLSKRNVLDIVDATRKVHNS